MILFTQRLRAVTLAASLLAASAATLAAQTVVTTTAPNGWFFYDGAGPGTDPSQITGAQPFDGNGSLQFTVGASNQQPSAGFFFGAPVALSSLSSLNLGYSWLVPTGTVPAASPTIRLLLTGLSNAGQPGTRTDGSLGWYNNGVNDTWSTGSFDLNTGDFFFRVGGVGQAATDCASAGSSFDDRRQDIATWISTCNGAGNVFNIDNASIVGVQVDWGTFVAPGSASSFADGVNFSIGGNDGDFNFEQPGGTQSVTPEPATMSLMALGLVGMVGAGRRRRRR